MFFYLLLTVLAILITYICVSNNRKQVYWAKYGVPFHKGLFGLGFFSDYVFKNRPVFQNLDEICKKYPGSEVIATNNFLNPTVIIKDPDNVQQILAGDFNTFYHRGFEINEDVDPLADNILLMNGIRWKLTRQKFTPLFTSAKLRNMYYIMNRSAEDFVKYLKDNPKKENAFSTLCTFCSAAISASVFGVGTKSTMESPFLDMARKSSESNFINNMKFALNGFSPKLFRLFKVSLFKEFENFFIGAIKQVLQLRRQEKAKSHDFAELCLAVQDKGTMIDPSTGYKIEPTDTLVSAQAFFFFIAGIEPSATTMFFTLFELAKEPEILQRLQDSIDELFEKSNGNISHDDIIGLEYLDQIIDEALRLHPPVGVITRKCTEKAVLKVGNIPIDEGVSIQIPVYSIHHDSKYYPNPEKFDPDRFTAEAKQQRPNYTHMAFGEGNRMCLGKIIINFIIFSTDF